MSFNKNGQSTIKEESQSKRKVKCTQPFLTILMYMYLRVLVPIVSGVFPFFKRRQLNCSTPEIHYVDVMVMLTCRYGGTSPLCFTSTLFTRFIIIIIWGNISSDSTFHLRWWQSPSYFCVESWYLFSTSTRFLTDATFPSRMHGIVPCPQAKRFTCRVYS